MIETRNLTRRYGTETVVDGVTLTLPRGGITALIGPNGAGKSTLLSMIGRLIGIDAGSVSVDGLDVARAKGDVLARRLSILRQENHVVARLSVRDLVAFGRYPHSKGRPTPADLEQVERALCWLGIEALADRFLDELSGGQRQRAFVAMVLCQDTDYVLLDEPLNNLDMRHAVTMMRQLRAAARELGKTVVVVLHDINFASTYADLIVAMKDGRIHATGTPEDIMRPELLHALYGIDARIHEIDGTRICVYYD
ncbi:ATP-binding cassette domain-containing protein [Paroceanicella profunda]|uniref:ATP-binding cassette domain-containing protein n=1 Tax=Paroceanicella profunda TaxID=2579971 RepID=A0A5B8FXC8_9RHOB|nr:ATP-binding cassette domain-containing protein [Paroceanicella profunda]QDL91142.1 ATP-binding cassette domain-containing protein [Paroceanicella profunda]